jgi:hypothetical protein
MSNPKEIRQALVKIANAVVNETIPPPVANSAISACNACLASLRTDEQERKIAELSAVIEELEQKFHF